MDRSFTQYLVISSFVGRLGGRGGVVDLEVEEIIQIFRGALLKYQSAKSVDLCHVLKLIQTYFHNFNMHGRITYFIF